MAASWEEVRGWINEGRKRGATHIISVCDTFDYDDYPIYVMPNQDLEEERKKYDGRNMQRINEVIELTEKT